MSQTSTIFRPSRVQNLVLYWPPYKAQLMLQSPTEANTCDIESILKYRPANSVNTVLGIFSGSGEIWEII